MCLVPLSMLLMVHNLVFISPGGWIGDLSFIEVDCLVAGQQALSGGL